MIIEAIIVCLMLGALGGVMHLTSSDADSQDLSAEGPKDIAQDKKYAKYNNQSYFLPESVNDLTNVEAANGSEKKGLKKRSEVPSFNQSISSFDDSKLPSSIDQNYKKTKQMGTLPMGTFDNSNSYIEYRKKDLAKDISKNSKDFFSFGYLYDTYSYSDSRNLFQETFEQGNGAHNAGFLEFSFGENILGTNPSIYTVANLGVGFHRGRGVYLRTREKSDTTFLNLWLFPAEVGLGVTLPLTDWITLKGAGGGGVMGAIQNRSDFDSSEKGKMIRQVGYGYFAEGHFLFNLSRMFPADILDMNTQYGMTRYSLDVAVRTHNYSNFQDDFSVSGVSFGAGLSFEYN